MTPKFFEMKAATSSGLILKNDTEMKKVINGDKPVPDRVEAWLQHGNRKWHECWHPIDYGFAFREDLFDQLNGAGLVGLRWVPVSFYRNESRLLLENAPSYQYLIPHVGLTLEKQNSVPPPQDWTHERRLPIAGSWSGADIFVASQFTNYCMYCTRKVVELARAKKWKEVKFFPLDLTVAEASRFNLYKGINYRGRHWPPQWYPDGYVPAPENLEA